MKKVKIFVIQHHFSKNEHYDFRLEMDGVLKSWAVPKEPPLEPGIKRLAIQVDDHAVEYAKFHGTIKSGYGKGTVKIWDYGEFDLISRDDSKIVFILKGKKMKGRYALVKFLNVNKNIKNAKNNWLLFKEK